MKFTQVAADAFEKLQLNAGVLLTDFDPDTGVLDRDDIFGATSGGVSFTASAEYTDFGEDIDNVPNNTKELKRISSITATMSGTFLTVDTNTAKVLAASADVDGNKVTPRADLSQSDFTDVWWVGDYSDANTGDNAGFIAIKLINALSTGGFQIQSGKDAKGTMSFEFTGHYSLEDITVVPYELYIQEGTADGGADATLSALTIGSVTLSPTFNAGVYKYTATTSNATNTVTATANDNDSTVIVTVNGNSIASGGSATWETGENTVKVIVSNDNIKKTYTVKVTKGE